MGHRIMLSGCQQTEDNIIMVSSKNDKNKTYLVDMTVGLRES